MRRPRTFWFAALVLASALALQWLDVRNAQEGDLRTPAQPARLAVRVPEALPGWLGRDEPLGPNERARSVVERTLNFDDYAYRVFTKAGAQIGVYVAYWAPGRMPLQKVASHTPDRCWTENGWACVELRFAETIELPGVKLRPAQWRVFTPPGAPAAREYVLFWHLVGDRLYDYGERFHRRPEIVRWWRDTVAYAFSGSDAQYFIRLTSDRPFAALAGDPGWEELLRALAQLGLGGAGGSGERRAEEARRWGTDGSDRGQWTARPCGGMPQPRKQARRRMGDGRPASKGETVGSDNLAGDLALAHRTNTTIVAGDRARGDLVEMPATEKGGAVEPFGAVEDDLVRAHGLSGTARAAVEHVDARGGGAHLVRGNDERGVLVPVTRVDANFDDIPLPEGEAHGWSGPASELRAMRAYSHLSSLREPIGG